MKINAAILGSGNIGSDLLQKAMRSKRIAPLWMVGVDPKSDGLAKAKAAGVKTTDQGVNGLLPFLDTDNIQIIFDATSASVHLDNAAKLKGRKAIIIDLTPAALGPYCIPPVNLDQLADTREPIINMVSCGGQATVPMVAAVSRVQPVDYAEIVATVASRSAGPGTRKNIDEFTRTTARALETVGGATRGKAIIILNPAEPPLVMRDTVHCLTRDKPDEKAIRASVEKMVATVQAYVPGFRLVNGPVFDGRRVSVFLEVKGLGDYLPEYAGNLDIMTAAALHAGEMLAGRMAGARH